VQNVARWNGSTWSAAGSGIGGPNAVVHSLSVFDDGFGSGAALYAGGEFTTAGGGLGQNVARWTGSAWSPLDTGADAGVFALTSFTSSLPALYAGGLFQAVGGSQSPYLAAWFGCSEPARAFCFGDGVDAAVTAPCPCNNFAAPGRGCASSMNALGATLAASGSVAFDTVVLAASGMPATATALFVKGNAPVPGGAIFGDGVRCAGGSLVLLGAKINVGGASHYPGTGDPSLATAGMTPPGSGLSAYYQTTYRNAASFCTSATFNTTSALRITW
jgi:hypothetical protein